MDTNHRCCAWFCDDAARLISPRTADLHDRDFNYAGGDLPLLVVLQGSGESTLCADVARGLRRRRIVVVTRILRWINRRQRHKCMLPLVLYKVSAVELCCFATDPLTPLFEENAALLHRFEANLLTSLLRADFAMMLRVLFHCAWRIFMIAISIYEEVIYRLCWGAVCCTAQVLQRCAARFITPCTADPQKENVKNITGMI